MATSVRLGQAADAAIIRQLTRSAYARWVPAIGREPIPMQVDYAEALKTHRFDLLYEDDALAGLIETVRRDDHLLIENLAVDPAHQGRGFGRRLLSLAEDLARAAGLGEVRLYTNKLFAENVALYRRVGYRVDREETSALGVTVYLTKPLA